jgi:hypothetical protein
MDDTQDLAEYLIRERLREAEARGAVHALLRAARRAEASRDGARRRRPGLWWHVATAWAKHLSLPKICNRL